MPHDPLVLLLNDPTRGVDVETKREIYIMLRKLAAAGKAVVLLSSDTPELVHLCDRVAVVRDGRIVAMLPRGEASEESIVSAAIGAEQAKGGGMSIVPADPDREAGALYWPVQLRRNLGVRSLFLVVLAFAVAYGFLFPGLFSGSGFAKFTQSWFPLALVAMAQAILMLTGGISLSIGATVSLGAVISATVMAGPFGVAGGVAAVAVAGLGIGALTGLIVVKLRLPAIVVTLAGSFIIGGAALLILPRPGGAIPEWLSVLLAGNTPTAFGLLVVIVLLWKLYLATPLGLSLYAAGENPLGAFRSGVAVDAARIAAYAISGLLCTGAGPVRRGADRLGRPAHRHVVHAELDRGGRARRHRLSRRPGHDARRAGRQPAAQPDDLGHVLPRLHAGRAICRAGPDHHRRRGHPAISQGA